MRTILSVVIPCYNEEMTLTLCLERVLAIAGPDLQLDIIVVDDASRDNSAGIAEIFAAAHPEVRVLRHGANAGKGAALKTGFAEARGDYVVVQDADLEYDPLDLLRMLPPLVAGDADAVFGSRFSGENARSMPYNRHRIGNQALTWLSNRFTGLALSDMETCYKMFRRDVIRAMDLREKRFGVEPEMAAKFAKMRAGGKRLRLREIAIGYNGRTYEQGKKIGIKDGFRALYCIVKYTFS